MGSFYRPKSDIDILFVVDDPLTAGQRRTEALTLCDLSDCSPLVGDLEVSVVRRTDTRAFRQPLPYEVHYSEKLKGAIRDGSFDFTQQRTDSDLAIHCTATRARGICLQGDPIEEVFGPVPMEANRWSILDDLQWILEGDHLLESPYYGVLNCCRVLQLESIGWEHVLSKDEGGEWALRELPEQYRPIVAQALACYRSPETVAPAARPTDGHDWDASALRGLLDYVRSRVERGGGKCRN